MIYTCFFPLVSLPIRRIRCSMASNCLEHLHPACQGTQRMGNPTALSDQFQTALPGRGSVEPWCLVILKLTLW